MAVVGKKNWIVPDCELPPEGEGVLKGHEKGREDQSYPLFRGQGSV